MVCSEGICNTIPIPSLPPVMTARFLTTLLTPYFLIAALTSGRSRAGKRSLAVRVLLSAAQLFSVGRIILVRLNPQQQLLLRFQFLNH
jgi:hypothetical protein